MSFDPSATTLGPADKVRQFPTSSGVYLLKDAQGRVLYIGKAKNLQQSLEEWIAGGVAGSVPSPGASLGEG